MKKNSKTLSPAQGLINSFASCAPMSAVIPPHPVSAEEASRILLNEARTQTLQAMIHLLYRHYGLQKGSAWSKLEVRDSISNDGDGHRFSIELSPDKIKRKALRAIKAGVDKFENDFLDASQFVEDIELVVPEKPELFAASYTDLGLFNVVDYMIATHHPKNKGAISHLHTAAHVMDRLYTQLPANRLI